MMWLLRDTDLADIQAKGHKDSFVHLEAVLKRKIFSESKIQFDKIEMLKHSI